MTKINKQLTSKQPVVVLVGHIDHGKSSILQSIKDLKITEKESGGITQGIGTYEIEEKGKKITFIDTPGHEAFSAMRIRGAKVADIAILVVAADDGVKPQTKEAITHLKKANIPIIVALNKIDKSDANPEKVKDELARNGLLVEDRGGDIPCIKTSAKTKNGIQDLLEMILLISDMQGLKVNILSPASGVVIESRMDRRRGPVSTLLLEDGVLKKGDIVGTVSTAGKVKRIEDFSGKEIEQAIAGQGTLVLGFNVLPVIGQNFCVYSSLEQAEKAIVSQKNTRLSEVSVSLEQKLFNLIIKSDVLGSIEPIEQVLKNLPQEKVILRILKKEAGDINLSDIKLAEESQALILGFRVKVSSVIAEIAQKKGVKILNVDLIYDLVEKLRNLMKKSLDTEEVRFDLATLKTLLIFKTDKKRQVIGAKILDGNIKKGLKIEVLRENEVIGSGKIVDLQKDKKKLSKGVKGDEVGILYEGSVRIQEDDILKAYEKRRQEVEI